MKAISIRVRDDRQDEILTVSQGMPVKMYETQFGIVCGVPLGTCHASGKACVVRGRLKPRYLKVKFMNHNNASTIDECEYCRDKRDNPYLIDSGKNDSEHVAVYLNAFAARSGASVMRSGEIEMIEGRWYSEKPVMGRSGRRFYPYSCPAVIIADTGRTYGIRYYDVRDRKLMALEFSCNIGEDDRAFAHVVSCNPIDSIKNGQSQG